MSLDCLKFEGRAKFEFAAYFYLLKDFASQLEAWLSLCVDIKVATSQVLEKVKDNECMKLTVRQVHWHEKDNLSTPFKSLKCPSLLLAFLEIR